MQGAQVRPLIKELRSHMPCSAAKKGKKKENELEIARGAFKSQARPRVVSFPPPTHHQPELIF